MHRAGEGAPYTGLKPAGLDVGPVIPLAEAAIESGSPDRLAAFLSDAVHRETVDRFDATVQAGEHANADVRAARAYVDAMLGLQVWAHKVYDAIHMAAHGEAQHRG